AQDHPAPQPLVSDVLRRFYYGRRRVGLLAEHCVGPERGGVLVLQMRERRVHLYTGCLPLL
ncbi:MAG: hypothetical protein AVDCRST_MAG89-5275, partial [uncultured Gemmatimonadetes bacterium]